MAHKLLWNVSPNFIKFETFPVFHLEPEHPLNRAFSAATADLGNQLVRLQSGDTNYDKDVGNFALLKSLLSYFPQYTPMAEFTQPTDMGVNVIERGIINPDIVAAACKSEIERRIRRYEQEIRSGSEVRNPHPDPWLTGVKTLENNHFCTPSIAPFATSVSGAYTSYHEHEPAETRCETCDKTSETNGCEL